MQYERMPKQIAAATVEGIGKRGRSRKGWRDEVEEDLNIMGIKNRQAVMSVKNSNDSIGNRTRGLSPCSAVSQPSATTVFNYTTVTNICVSDRIFSRGLLKVIICL